MAAPMPVVATAAANGDLMAIQQLIKEGADVNARSGDGMTPLAIAAFWGYADIARVLLENGADISLSNRGTQWTPLHCASFQGHGKVIMHLMEYSPDLHARDSQGRTPVDFASAIEGVWAFFAAAGCKKTPKADLIRMDIVKKVSADDPAFAQSDLLGLTRPGSAYIFNTDSLHGRQTDRNQVLAAATGDVLAGVEDAEPWDRRGRGGGQPAMTLWNN